MAGHWRYTAEAPKFFMIDARVTLPFVLMLFHLSWATFYVSVGGVALFLVLGWYRMSPMQGIRALLLILVTLGFRRNDIGHRPRREPIGRWGG